MKGNQTSMASPKSPRGKLSYLENNLLNMFLVDVLSRGSLQNAVSSPSNVYLRAKKDDYWNKIS